MNFNVFTAKKGLWGERGGREETHSSRRITTDLYLNVISVDFKAAASREFSVFSMAAFFICFFILQFEQFDYFQLLFYSFFNFFDVLFFFLLEIKESTVKFIRCLRNCTPLCLKTVNRACKQTFNWYEKMPQRSNQRDARDMQQDAKIERYNLRYIGHKTFLMNKWNNEWMNKWTLKWPRYGMARKWNLGDQRLHYMHSICIRNTHTLIVGKAEKQSCNFS